MTEPRKKLVVVGGVAAGTSAASRARRVDPELEIVLFEKGPHVSYGACDEPYFIGGEVPSWDRLLVRSPEQFETKQNIHIRLNCEVIGIDAGARTVEVVDHGAGLRETHAWDALVIATGARPRRLDLPGAGAPNVFQLKFLDQARTLKSFLDSQRPKRAVTVGAGFIALEMAEAFYRLSVINTILHRRSGPGGRTEPEVADRIIDTLDRNGVRYVPDCRIERFDTDGEGRVTGVVTSEGEFENDLVLSAVGVEPDVGLAVAAGVALGPTGAIAVDERQETLVPGIYAAGDCCETRNRITGEPTFTPLGDIANKQGWTAGENAAGGEALYRGSLGSMHFRCFDLEVGMTGLTAAEATERFDAHATVIEHRSRAHAQPRGVPILVKLVADRKTGRLLGGQLAGTEGAALRVNALAVALHAGLTIEDLQQADFAYAPPFSPVIDPILLAARVMTKEMAGS
ncbi:FAD-dependent oxidoreductase [Thermodesulfobacteriota bacterium]